MIGGGTAWGKFEEVCNPESILDQQTIYLDEQTIYFELWMQESRKINQFRKEGILFPSTILMDFILNIFFWIES